MALLTQYWRDPFFHLSKWSIDGDFTHQHNICSSIDIIFQILSRIMQRISCQKITSSRCWLSVMILLFVLINGLYYNKSMLSTCIAKHVCMYILFHLPNLWWILHKSSWIWKPANNMCDLREQVTKVCCYLCHTMTKCVTHITSMSVLLLLWYTV